MSKIQSVESETKVKQDLHDAATTPATEDEARMLLELASVDLICQFESMLSRCIRCRHGEEMEAIGEIVEQTMREALDFGDANLTGKSRSDLTRRVNRTNKYAQELAAAVSVCSWDAVRRVLGREVVTELDVLKIHSEVGNAAAIVALTAIGPVIERLGHKSRSGAEMLKCLKLLVADMKSSW